MTCKHVDVLAITVLLLGMALFSHVRHAVAPAIFYKQRVIIEPLHRPLVVFPKPPSIKVMAD